MNAPVLHRRRIERYAQLLDEANGARRHHTRSPIDDELANMLAVSQGLTAITTSVAPSEEFRRDARAMLMATAERDGIGRTAKADAPELVISRPAVGRASVGTVHESAARRLLHKQRGPKARLTTNRARTRGAILVGLAVGTLALSGISAASGDAMPGDALYGMKRHAENAQIALARTSVEKGNLYLDFARTRLSEAEQARPTASTIEGTLASMDRQTTDGVRLLFTDAVGHKDAKALTDVQQFLSAQSKQLTLWEQGLPFGPARDRALKSRSVLDGMQLRANQIHTALACTSSIRIVTKDSLGPEPACQVGATAGPSITPVRRSGGVSTGTGTTTKPAEHAPAASTIAKSTAPASTPVASAPVAPDPGPEPSYDGGVLGSVEHLLGGL